jgi:Phage portal protein, SPP1 Gp6-like
MKIEQYIKLRYDNKPETWFVEETSLPVNAQRVRQVLDNKNYIEGNHKVLDRKAFEYNGKKFTPRKIVLQYVKVLLRFAASYLLQNNTTLTGNDSVRKEYEKVYRKGKYHRLNQKILDQLLKHGEVYEYVYYGENKAIKSKLIAPENAFPVYSPETNEMMAFIEHYISDYISFYNVYYHDRVEVWNDIGGEELRLIDTKENVTGLPIAYIGENELDNNHGKSDIDDWVTIVDALEDLISKYMDATYKYIDPIPVSIGQRLVDAQLPSDIVGKGINLDDGSDFKFVSGQLDSKSFEVLFKTLKQSLLDISSTPGVSLNSQEVSNLSETSMKILFQLADTKASVYEGVIKDGIEERHDKIKLLLDMTGVSLEEEGYDTLGVVFNYARPQNDTELINNLRTLKEILGISLDSLLEKNPYVTDVETEKKRLEVEAKELEKKQAKMLEDQKGKDEDKKEKDKVNQ